MKRMVLLVWFGLGALSPATSRYVSMDSAEHEVSLLLHKSVGQTFRYSSGRKGMTYFLPSSDNDRLDYYGRRHGRMESSVRSTKDGQRRHVMQLIHLSGSQRLAESSHFR